MMFLYVTRNIHMRYVSIVCVVVLVFIILLARQMIKLECSEKRRHGFHYHPDREHQSL